MKTRSRHSGAIVLSMGLVAFILITSGCSMGAKDHSQSPQTPSTGATTSSPTKRDSDMTFPTQFNSVEPLGTEADLVVVGTATERVSKELILDLETRVIDFEIDRVLAIRPSVEATKTVPIAQEDSLFNGDDVRLVPGQKYLLFLQHFEFKRGEPFGSNYVVLGGSTGAFSISNGLESPSASISSLDRNLRDGDLSGLTVGTVETALSTLDMKTPRSSKR